MSDVLTLSEVLGRSVSVEWHEAVAIVRGVVARLLEGADRTYIVPELYEIEISAEGRIDVVRGMGTPEPVRRLGQLLQAMLGQSDPPVQLRLIISQATAPNPSFGSIDEFDQALGYFERPDRNAVVRALYARAAAAAPSPAGSQSKPTLDTIAPLLTPKQQESAQLRAATRRRVARLAVVVGLIGVACAATVQYVRVIGITPRTGDALAVARRISSRVGASILSGVSAVTERAGLGRLVTNDTTNVESPPEAAAPARSPGVRQTPKERSNAPAPAPGAKTPVQLDPQVAPLVAFDLEPAPIAAVPPPDALDTPSTLARNENSADERPAVDLNTVYSAESVGVVPPVGVRPQLPQELPPNINRQDLLSIELIVLPDGSVESVKLLRAPTNMRDVMWLSAVKAFEFRPALKDGVPVKYRKIVSIAYP